VKTEAGQQIWNECSRLIANAIIYYNTLLLSRVYEHKLAANDQNAIEILKGISPVAWRNVLGVAHFTPGSAPTLARTAFIKPWLRGCLKSPEISMLTVRA
jgi:hypothetical protein